MTKPHQNPPSADPSPTKIPLEHAKMMNIHEFTQSLDAFQNGHQTEENGNQAP